MGNSLGGHGFSPLSTTFTVDFTNIFNHDRKVIKKKARRDYERFKTRWENNDFELSHSIPKEMISEQTMSAPVGNYSFLIHCHDIFK